MADNNNEGEDATAAMERRAAEMSKFKGIYVATAATFIAGIPLLIIGVILLANDRHYDAGLGLLVAGVIITLVGFVLLIIIVTGRHSAKQEAQAQTSVQGQAAVHHTPVGSVLEAMGSPPPSYGHSSGHVSSAEEASRTNTTGSRHSAGASHSASHVEIAVIPMPGCSTDGQPQNGVAGKYPLDGVDGRLPAKPEATPPLATSSMQSYYSDSAAASRTSSLSGYGSLT